MNNLVDQFKSILKKKGTGKTMSKHMDLSDIEFVLSNLKSKEVPLAMKSTLLTAWMMLDSSVDELEKLTYLKSNYKKYVSDELFFLFEPPSLETFDQAIYDLRNHQSISNETLTHCLNQICAGDVSEEKTTALFEGLRLKEETFEENACVYDYFRSKTMSYSLDVPLLIDFATPYDGFNRSYFLQPFVASLLAAVGIPVILHGVHEVSPKNGQNTHKLFLKAQKNPLKSSHDVAQDIKNPSIGWGYIDQSIFCKELHNLIQMRFAMVKRPLLATIEKWLQPFSADQTICFTGFTHPPYKQKTIDLLNHANLYSDFILVRGVEGSTLLPSDRRTPFITGKKGHDVIFDFMSPETFEIDQFHMDEQMPEDTLTIGESALSGNNEAVANFLRYQCLVIGHFLNKDMFQFNEALLSAITSGKALAHWKALT